MRNKLIPLGYGLVIVGITMLLTLILLMGLGVDVSLKDGISFEEDQTQQQMEDNGGGSGVQMGGGGGGSGSGTGTGSGSTGGGDSISIPGFESWTIPANTTNVPCHFYNPAQNDCYFVLTVTLTDTNAKIYESKYIKPGYNLYNVDLLTPVPAGTYDAVLRYDTYSLDDMSPMNGASVPFTLVVQ